MLEKGRIMHVLSVVCLLLVSSGTQHITAFPTGDMVNVEGELPDYSPSYAFVDEYLRHSGQDISPSDSELGDLIWGILYQPMQQPSPVLKHGLSEGLPVIKRQQGWHVNYGKRNIGYKRPKQQWQNERSSDFDFLDDNRRTRNMLRAGSERLTTKFDPYSKRQQGWFVDYGKRGIDASQWYGYPETTDHPVDTTSDLEFLWNLRPQPSRASPGQSWYPGMVTRNPEVTQLNKRQQGWFVDYGKRNVNSDIWWQSKRQQGWHTPYGKR